MAVSLRAHRAALVKAGRLDARHRVPELNSRVWDEHAALSAAFGVSECDRMVVEGPGGLAAWGDDDEPFTLAGLDCISDPQLPFTAAELIAGLPALLAALVAHAGSEARLVTDTFALPALPEPAERRCFVWLVSPVAHIPARAEDYPGSLTPKRRQRLRRARAMLAARGTLQVRIDETPPTDAELARIAEWQAHRFGEAGFAYALRQHLFAAAAGRALPGSTLTLRADWDGEPVLFAAYVIRGDRITSQATARHPERCPSDLGTLVDALLIEQLCGGTLRVLDPTCRLSLSDPPAIGVAKRAVVNADHHKPLLLAGAVDPSAPEDAPRLDAVRGWLLPAAPVVVGDPA